MKALTVLVAIIILGLVFLGFKLWDNQNPSYPVPSPGTSTTSTNSLVRVTSPLPNTAVKSPLVITGEARGNWYFEASFPVKILDANGEVLGVHYATAQGEWMTTEFVPFVSTLVFATSTTPTGTLVLEKDNPSGLPENANEIRIPVTFSNVNSQTRTIKLYFYDQNRDKDAQGNILCSSQGLVPAERVIPFTTTPIQDAVKELLKSDQAFSGVTLSGANLSNSVLTLTFSDPQNKTSGGSCKVSILRAQIEATAKQFGGVNSVRFMPASVFQP